MHAVKLNYGRRTLDVPLPDGRWLGALQPRAAPALAPLEDHLRNSLRNPMGSPPLRELAAGARSAAILISGSDRVTGSDRFLPVLGDELNAAGLSDEQIVVWLATGTHQKQTDADRRLLLGPAIDRFACRQHDPRDPGNLVDLGATSFGTPIRLNRAVYESDVKILTGRIAHHYFAGFSGGRKAIAPGVSAFETITANHKLVMDRHGRGRHPAVFLGSLDGNPVHEDMLQIARAAKPSFCLNTVLNPRHEITQVFSGDFEIAHRQGCAVVASQDQVRLDERANLVVASCGGWPYDISFMQVVKTIVAAERAVADGGVLVVLGACERGLEPGFLEWFDYTSLDELNRDVLAKYNLKGHNTYWIKSIQARMKIVLVSDLPEQDVGRMGFVAARDEKAGLQAACSLVGPDPSILAIPYGNLTVCRGPDTSQQGFT